MYPEQVTACSGFLLLFLNRLAVLVEQLARAVRRLAGDVLHRHALAQIGLIVRRGEVGGDLQIAHELVVDHHLLGAVLARRDARASNKGFYPSMKNPRLCRGVPIIPRIGSVERCRY